MPGVAAGLIRELIVCDGGSTDATVALAKAWGAEVVTSAPSRGGQLRFGCSQAKGDWLLVLHADTVLQPDWIAPVVTHLNTDQAGWFRLAFTSGGVPGCLVAGWANLRSRFGLPYGDQGLLVPVPLYASVGGYTDQPLMEDVAMARALRGQLRPVDAVARTSAAKYHTQGWLTRGLRNLWTLLRYLVGVSPETLARSYRAQGSDPSRRT